MADDWPWPFPERRVATFGVPTDALHTALSDWLRREAEDLHRVRGAYRMLDAGCGGMPYYPWFEPFASEYVALDSVDNPLADLRGRIEAIPAETASFDLVLCTQVLEHCDDPAQAIRELRRVLRPDGRLLLSTHGVMVYHPAPQDLWRWTHEGLRRLFLTNASWSSVTVKPAIGTTATLALLLSIYVQVGARRAHVMPLGQLLIDAMQRVGAAVDRRSERLRGLGPGTLHANYHVRAMV